MPPVIQNPLAAPSLADQPMAPQSDDELLNTLLQFAHEKPPQEPSGQLSGKQLFGLAIAGPLRNVLLQHFINKMPGTAEYGQQQEEYGAHQKALGDLATAYGAHQRAQGMVDARMIPKPPGFKLVQDANGMYTWLPEPTNTSSGVPSSTIAPVPGSPSTGPVEPGTQKPSNISANPGQRTTDAIRTGVKGPQSLTPVQTPTGPAWGNPKNPSQPLQPMIGAGGEPVPGKADPQIQEGMNNLNTALQIVARMRTNYDTVAKQYEPAARYIMAKGLENDLTREPVGYFSQEARSHESDRKALAQMGQRAETSGNRTLTLVLNNMLEQIPSIGAAPNVAHERYDAMENILRNGLQTYQSMPQAQALPTTAAGSVKKAGRMPRATFERLRATNPAGAQNFLDDGGEVY